MLCSPLLPVLSSLLALGGCGDTRALQFQTSQLDSEGPERYASLYKAPAPYQSLGRPLLNSFIVTSRPLDITKVTDGRRKGGEATEGASSPLHHPHPEDEGHFRHIPQFRIECVAGRGPCSETITVAPPFTTPPTFKQHSQESITRFVDTLNGIRRNGHHDDPSEGSEGAGEHPGKLSKANLWYRPSPHSPPHHDKKGWVALDPVPWSSSKISKWTPDKSNPGSKPPEATRAPHPTRGPSAEASMSYHRRPPVQSYQAGQGSHQWNGPQKPQRPHDSYHSASSSSSPIIITDGRDPEWPTAHGGHQRPSHDRPGQDRPQAFLQVRPESGHPNYYPDHRPSVGHRPHGWGASGGQQVDGGSRRPQNYPTPIVYHDGPSPQEGGGGGQWVVLSDTKEYKPKSAAADRRSSGRLLAREEGPPAKVGRVRTSRRMVRLTVLPSEGNVTVSHGGMLEVDGSFDTVDEDRRKRMLAQGEGEGNKANIVVHALTRGQAKRRDDRAKAVMAAVGAGMVPATVAAILPMVLARRSRRSPPAEDIARNIERLPKNFKNFRNVDKKQLIYF